MNNFAEPLRVSIHNGTWMGTFLYSSIDGIYTVQLDSGQIWIMHPDDVDFLCDLEEGDWPEEVTEEYSMPCEFPNEPPFDDVWSSDMRHFMGGESG